MTRIDMFATAVAPRIVQHLVAADSAVHASPLPRSTVELVNIRASQINGCGACLDMHVKEAEAAGVTALRIGLVGAWRETTVYTAAERAALALTEAATRLADTAGVPDDVWADAAGHFDDEQLAALVAQISLINAFNRLNVMVKVPGGSYDPSQRAAAVAAATAGGEPTTVGAAAHA
ncbi:carboxymuconolactone decarboxylase family protein [Cellulomonas sp. HZM]|uniref:carboxymuconolactone decarboxylase family protein n=1 Tax=Cellulomonas sp. HZM TaxID=1454010 RepID=UPI001E3EAA75|nr:carboxymuconolactone decarboxylase family protein [Cellulomonas sp. HZM]